MRLFCRLVDFLVLEQVLNGLQLGILLFLIAAGLTLVFGVMDFINLAHGVQYMLGAYLAVAAYAVTGTFWGALALGLVGFLATVAFARFVLRRRYEQEFVRRDTLGIYGDKEQ